MGANIIFRTSESITLNPGFTMGKASTFIAELYTCDGYNEPQTTAQNYLFGDSKKDDSKPLEFSLSQNYPNPFNPATSINYSIRQSSWVTLIIYNILGQEVKKLVDNYEDAGYRYVLWDGTNNYGNAVSSGIYFYKLTAGDFVDQKKMVIIR